MNACTRDKCQQGLRNCPCPQACELPITMEEPDAYSRLAVALTVVAVLMVVGLIVINFLERT